MAQDRERAEQAATEINNINRARGHVLTARSGETADVMPTPEMAEIIAKHLEAARCEERKRTLEECAEFPLGVSNPPVLAGGEFASHGYSRGYIDATEAIARDIKSLLAALEKE